MAVLEEVRDGTRQRLLEVAGEVFAEKGLKGGTIREICARAGVNLAAVNYHFRDKERLYNAAVAQAACGGLGTAQPSWPEGTPPAEKLRDFIHLFMRRWLDRGRPAWHAQLMMREMAQPTGACAEVVRDLIRPMSDVLQGILAELLPPGTPRRRRYMTGFSIVGQCLHYCMARPIARQLMGEEEFDRLDPATVADHITRFTLAAFGLAAPVGRAANHPDRGAP
jgi:AcrR family transcriptional regulator